MFRTFKRIFLIRGSWTRCSHLEERLLREVLDRAKIAQASWYIQTKKFYSRKLLSIRIPKTNWISAREGLSSKFEPRTVWVEPNCYAKTRICFECGVQNEMSHQNSTIPEVPIKFRRFVDWRPANLWSKTFRTQCSSEVQTINSNRPWTDRRTQWIIVDDQKSRFGSSNLRSDGRFDRVQ